MDFDRFSVFRAVKGSAAGTPEFVFEFLTALNEEFRDEVKADMNLIQKAKAADSDQVEFTKQITSQFIRIFL